MERDFHKFLNIPDYELNRLCVNHLDNPDALYVDSHVQFSKYMQTTNNDKGTKYELTINYVLIFLSLAYNLCNSFCVLCGLLNYTFV